MWARNLLLLGVVAVATWAFVASVFPFAEPHQRQTRLISNVASVRTAAGRVDAAFEKSWLEANVAPAEPASDLAVARRLSLALTGTIPSLEEIRHLESLAPAERLDSWLAELLSDRRYADFVAERWARAFVGVEDGPFLLFRRRRFVSWLADQLSANEPYDRVVRHLISDSGLWTDTPSTNFITATIQPGEEKGPDANQLAARVSRAFLGVRIDCAECHDHPFEPWKQRDFQNLAAFFGSTRQSLGGIRDRTGAYRVENRQTGKMETITCGVPFERQLLPDSGSTRHRLAAWVTHSKNRAFAREAVNRAWALMFGRGLVEPIDNLAAQTPLPAPLDLLADDFVEHGYDWRRLIEVIAATRAFRLESKAMGEEPSDETAANQKPDWSVFPLVRLRPEQVVGALLQSASLSTIDSESHILVRLARQAGQRDFITRYGDGGAEEFEVHGGTIPQRLLLMNGQIVHDKTKDNLFFNAATQIAAFAPDDDTAIETVMLAVLTRRPSSDEHSYFTRQLAGAKGTKRKERLNDLVWTLINSTEFSWNH